MTDTPEPSSLSAAVESVAEEAPTSFGSAWVEEPARSEIKEAIRGYGGARQKFSIGVSRASRALRR